MWKKSFADGYTNFFSIHDEYIHFRRRIANDCDRFFFAADLRATIKNKFLKRQLLGKRSFLSDVKSCCAAEGSRGWVLSRGYNALIEREVSYNII